MAMGNEPDPVHATFVAILQQLNRSESMNEGRSREQALHLDDLERVLRRFWAIDEERVKLPLALGLLLRNKMVEVERADGVSAPPASRGKVRYRITSTGKQFLVESVTKTDRIA